MASKAQIEAVEVYTTTEPCMSKSLQYKGLVLVSKVERRNVFSDFCLRNRQTLQSSSLAVRRVASSCLHQARRTPPVLA